MFTGIIETTGTIESFSGHQLSVRTPWTAKEISLGQSISVHGCCLTVVKVQDHTLTFDLSDETLDKTFFSNSKPNQKLNLERGLEMGKRIDGH